MPHQTKYEVTIEELCAEDSLLTISYSSRFCNAWIISRIRLDRYIFPALDTFVILFFSYSSVRYYFIQIVPAYSDIPTCRLLH
jgi:hypothetical protein